MFTVSYFGAKINEGSQQTAEIVNCIPYEHDLPELRHFRDFLASAKIALTAMGFFSLTKRLILAVNVFFSMSRKH